MIKVLIVDDSATIREYLTSLFIMDGGFQILGTAKDGDEAVKMVQLKKPDVVTMDIQMPKMDGFEATRRIMETYPVPIVIVSSIYNPNEVQDTFKAMEAGAVAAVRKPKGIGREFDSECASLVRTIKLMSEVKVITRRPLKRKPIETVNNSSLVSQVANYDILAIGASTGGPPVLQTMFARITKSLSVPVVVVQHITPGFIEGLVEWLKKTTRLPVHIASEGEYLQNGHIYFAPDAYHMGIKRTKQVFLSTNPPENSIRPSVSFLFRSIAEAFGKRSIGVLLTGMGKDGAVELKLMKDSGALTFAQDQESSTVFGMPGEAMKIDAARYMLPPDDIVDKINYLFEK